MKIQQNQSQPSFKALIIKNKLAPKTLERVSNLTQNTGFEALFGQTFFGGDRLCINTKQGTKEESLMKTALAAILGDKNPIVSAPAEKALKLIERFSFCRCKPLEKSVNETFN